MKISDLEHWEGMLPSPELVSLTGGQIMFLNDLNFFTPQVASVFVTAKGSAEKQLWLRTITIITGRSA